ncbi:MAG: sugar ABC transporter substrate-binding protein [Burkholderiales bacterium 28-67-8]|nr:MAG: sugar ABC transporter substrate-binding protein [Burkholderiales bacterium 28-67-8]
MSDQTPPAITSKNRRGFIRTAGALGLAASVAPPLLRSANAAPKVLKIMQWNHFVPAFDEWFNKSFTKEWGEQNNTEVVVTNVGMTSLDSRAAAEIGKKQGHDLCMFLSPPASYEDQVIDHAEVYAECEKKYGKPLDIAIKSTYNPVTQKYFGFSDSYVPDPVNYRQDLWDDVGVKPDSWDAIRDGGRKIKEKHGIPVGLGMSNELDSSMALRSMLLSFGGGVQDADGRASLKSRQTLEALKYARALYTETMTDEIFSWDASSNNRLMLAGKGSLTLNAISITRTGESEKIPVASKIMLGRPARGPAAQLGVMHLMNAYVIWNFARNISGAKKFLVDLAGHSRDAFMASGFYNFPTFPQLVPDLQQLVANDPKATPSDKYAIFSDASKWTVPVGYPGYANAAVDEIWKEWIVPRMFADAASGRLTPEASMDLYSGQVAEIYKKWQGLRKV